MVMVILRQIDYEDDWTDDSGENIVFHKKSSSWTLHREELPDSKEIKMFEKTNILDRHRR